MSIYLYQQCRLQQLRLLSVLVSHKYTLFNSLQAKQQQVAAIQIQQDQQKGKQEQHRHHKHFAIFLGTVGALLPVTASCKPADDDDEDEDDDDEDEEIPSGWGWNPDYEPYFHSNEHTRRWRECSDMGRDYMNKGLYGQAEYYMTIALEEARHGWGNYDGHVGTTLSNIGELYRLQKKYKTAEPHYKEAVDVMEEVYGTHHVFYAEVVQNLGLFYAEMGRYDESIENMMLAYKIFKQNLGQAHEKTAQIQCRVAEIYRLLKNYDKSAEFFDGALESFQRHGSANEPACLFVISRYCDMLLESGNLEDLPEMMQRMLNISDFNKGEHVEYLQRVLMAVVSKDEDLAREYMTKCLDLKMKHNPHTSPKVAEALRQAAEFEMTLKDADVQKSLKYAKQAARLHREEWNYHSSQAKTASYNYEAMREKMRSDDVLIAGMDYAKTLNTLATVYEKSGDMQSTEKVLRKVCSILTDRNVVTIVKRFRSYDEAYSSAGSSIRSTRMKRAEKVDRDRREILVVSLQRLIRVLQQRPDALEQDTAEEILRLRSELQQFMIRQDKIKEQEAGLPK
eukprot:TRINITY_DN8342_c0_g1_i1.p1 TRINITY_DN8342_c0_g1~~TRINITY_DN8342_c0_g1_i1.p1  ORF type:complete len:565 (-),score=102.09 TRINITY_DN8342_c0_g1_i1:225-1919(-)